MSLGSYPYTSPANPRYVVKRVVDSPPGYHQAMFGLGRFDHGVFDNDVFWRYVKQHEFDPNGILDGVGTTETEMQKQESALLHGLFVIGAFALGVVFSSQVKSLIRGK